MSDDLHPYPGNLKHHKVEPPFSDEQLFGDCSPLFSNSGHDRSVARYFTKLCEAARAKDAELIQQLVDAALYIYWTKPEAAKARMNEVLKAAAAAGFKPSEQ